MVAGLTVGLTVIPQGIAYAQVAGLSPNVSATLEPWLASLHIICTFHESLVFCGD